MYWRRQESPEDDNHHRYPEEDDTDGRSPARGLIAEHLGLSTKFAHEVCWHELYGEPDAERHENQVVDIAEHRNEVRDEIDRRQRISGRNTRHELGAARH